MLYFSPKTIKVNNSLYLHFWYANNKGNENNNVSIVCTFKAERETTSANQKAKSYISEIKRSHWKGKIVLSERAFDELTIEFYNHEVITND